MAGSSMTAEGHKDVVVKIPVQDAKRGELSHLGGAASDEFNRYLADSLLKALPHASEIFGTQTRELAYVAVAVGQVEGKPADVFEGMIISQIQSAHAAANELHRLAWIKNQPFEVKARYLGLADKAQRTMGALVETLAKYRGKGRQTVRVEHVTVNAESAIVGSVTHGGRG